MLKKNKLNKLNQYLKKQYDEFKKKTDKLCLNKNKFKLALFMLKKKLIS